MAHNADRANPCARWANLAVVMRAHDVRYANVPDTRNPHQIDTRLCLRYHAGMSSRPRPDGCCTVPNLPAPLSPADADRMVAIFKALGDSTRLGIFRLIAAQDAELCVCDITSRFDVSQPTISHHLRVLRDAGLVTVARRGVWAYYAVDPQGMAFLHESVGALAPSLLAEVP